MKRLILVLAAAIAAQAGILKVATYPVRHPVKTIKTTLKTGTYPVRHPIKTVF